MKYAVAVLSEFENVLTIEIVEASNWKDALSRHSKMRDPSEETGDLSWLPDTIEEAKVAAFSADLHFDVKTTITKSEEMDEDNYDATPH